MRKLRIRPCDHCRNGEVFIDHDQYGWFESCLQCGYSRDLPDLVPPTSGWNQGVKTAEAEKVQPPMFGKVRAPLTRKWR